MDTEREGGVEVCSVCVCALCMCSGEESEVSCTAASVCITCCVSSIHTFWHLFHFKDFISLTHGMGSVNHALPPQRNGTALVK